MANIHNLIGQKFGTLTVICRTKNEKGNQARFICKCDCGKDHIVHASALFSGNFEKCDCQKSTKTNIPESEKPETAAIKPQIEIETATKPKRIKASK